MKFFTGDHNAMAKLRNGENVIIIIIIIIITDIFKVAKTVKTVARTTVMC